MQPEAGKTGDTLSRKYPRAEDCPDARKHTKCPKGYLQWHEWAEKKAKTHHQVRCPSCNFWSIWEPN